MNYANTCKSLQKTVSKGDKEQDIYFRHIFHIFEIKQG